MHKLGGITYARLSSLVFHVVNQLFGNPSMMPKHQNLLKWRQRLAMFARFVIVSDGFAAVASRRHLRQRLFAALTKQSIALKSTTQTRVRCHNLDDLLEYVHGVVIIPL